MAKFFERISYKQINNFKTAKFFPFLCGFRKTTIPNTFFLKWWKSGKYLDKVDHISVILMDLSNNFEKINHCLVLAKLEASGFSTISLKLMQSCLCSRFERTKVTPFSHKVTVSLLPLTWIFCSRSLNHSLKYILKHDLTLIYDNLWSPHPFTSRYT